MREKKVYQSEPVFGYQHTFGEFEIYVFVADAFTYENRGHLEDKFILIKVNG